MKLSKHGPAGTRSKAVIINNGEIELRGGEQLPWKYAALMRMARTPDDLKLAKNYPRVTFYLLSRPT